MKLNGIKKVKICPVCKTKNITLWMGAKLGILYYCKSCGYVGPLVVEEDVEEK
jgi:predicted RNA-binding Zn-ribbon protein involved in translation (DUF1610 family)